MSEDFRDRLRALPPELTPATDLPARVERVARRRRTVRRVVASSGLVVALVAAGVSVAPYLQRELREVTASSAEQDVAQSFSNPDPPVGSDRPSATSLSEPTTVRAEFGCPVDSSLPVVDARPDLATRLVADEPVRDATVCVYGQSADGRELTRAVALSSAQSSRLIADWRALAAGEVRTCRQTFRADLTRYLVRLGYADAADHWVLVEGGTTCGATNGSFTTGVDLAPQLAALTS